MFRLWTYKGDDMRQRFHKVFITSSIREGEYKTRLFGKVHPRTQDVQVFVKSLHDNKWYKQAPVVKHGTRWFCDVALGFNSSESIGNHFEVIAIADPRIEENVLSELPPLNIHSTSHFMLRT